VDAFAAYPDPNPRALTKAIAEKEQVQAEQVLCGNGAADLIYRVCLSQKPKHVLMIAPTFSEYERAARLCGSEIRYHRLHEQEQFALTERILDDIRPEVDLLFLCNPNNPTGKRIDRNLLIQIAQQCVKTDTMLLMDECFLSFSEEKSLSPLIEEIPNLLILKAFTKMYAMAGLRLGYLLSANQAILQACKDYAPCWNVSAVAQTAGFAALQCENWEEETRQLVVTERAYLANALETLGFQVYDSDANFLLFHSHVPLYDSLIEKRILIRPCENYVGLDERFYRIAVKLRPENERLIRAMKEVVHG
jgi:threonine-phosphate decarboxylase